MVCLHGQSVNGDMAVLWKLLPMIPPRDHLDLQLVGVGDDVQGGVGHGVFVD
jgi:hypothetical protein